MGAKLGRSETEVGPKWDRSGTEVGPKWDRSGTEAVAATVVVYKIIHQIFGVSVTQKQLGSHFGCQDGQVSVPTWVPLRSQLGSHFGPHFGPLSVSQSPNFGPSFGPPFGPTSVPWFFALALVGTGMSHTSTSLECLCFVERSLTCNDPTMASSTPILSSASKLHCGECSHNLLIM